METSFSHRGPLLRLATITMVGEQMMLSRSPCGLNCSYELEFEGPVLSCVESATNMTYNETYGEVFLYMRASGRIWIIVRCQGKSQFSSLEY